MLHFCCQTARQHDGSQLIESAEAISSSDFFRPTRPLTFPKEIGTRIWFESRFPALEISLIHLTRCIKLLLQASSYSFANSKSERMLRIPILSHVRVLLIDENNCIR
jgi:hypothetical protein